MHRFKIVILLLLAYGSAFAQTTGTSGNLDIKDKLLLRSGLYIPSGTASAGLQGGVNYPGAIYHKTNDSGLYVYDGTTWRGLFPLWSNGTSIQNRNSSFVKINNGLRVVSGYVSVGDYAGTQAVDMRGEEIEDVSILSRLANNTTTDVGAINFQRALGTLDAPLPITNGTIIGSIKFNGHNGVTYPGSRALIQAVATQNWSVDTNGVRLNFSLTPDNSSTIREQMRLSENGLAIKPYIGTNRSGIYALVDVADTATTSNMYRATYFNDDATKIPALDFYRAAGTNVTPDTIATDTYLGAITARGYAGTAFAKRIGIYFKSSEAWTPSVNGAEMLFNITPNASTTETTKLKITTGYTEVVDALHINTVANGAITDSVLVINTNVVNKVAKPVQSVLASTFNSTIGAASTSYAGMNGSPAFNGTEANRLFVIPVNVTGTIKGLTIAMSGAQSGTGSLVFTIRKGTYSAGVLSMSDQTVTVTVAAGATAGVYTDNSNSFTVTGNDIVTIKVVNNASATSGTIAAVSVTLL